MKDAAAIARLELARARQRYYLWHTRENYHRFRAAAQAHRAILQATPPHQEPHDDE